jgi:hypothetical protein
MDTEHAFSAAIMLLMVCAAFPPDAANEASLRDALALLGSMWARGNQHMGERYVALQHLAAGMLPNLDLGGAAAESAYGSSDTLFDLDMPMLMDGFLVSTDGMGSMASAAAPGLDQDIWDAALDTCNVMRN